MIVKGQWSKWYIFHNPCMCVIEFLNIWFVSREQRNDNKRLMRKRLTFFLPSTVHKYYRKIVVFIEITTSSVQTGRRTEM